MRFVSALALFLSCLSSAQALAGSDPALDTVLVAAMKDKTIPGMGVAVIRDGKLSGVAVRGNRDIGQADRGAGRRSMADRVRYQADDGDADCAAWPSSTSFRSMRRFRRLLPQLAAKARPEYRAITLRQMLHHTIGTAA